MLYYVQSVASQLISGERQKKKELWQSKCEEKIFLKYYLVDENMTGQAFWYKLISLLQWGYYVLKKKVVTNSWKQARKLAKYPICLGEWARE